ncbi:MAG TPA: hypothetical protein VFO52_09460 [Longimicrobiales bacterium]|nr:hypothetical protein [Longimicrobiales bacterium]
MKYMLLLAAVALPACDEATGPDDETGRVLLEIEYVNYAWTPQYFGFFLDATGDVYSYNRDGTPWAHGEDRVITAEQLEEKFSLKRTLVATRDTAEIRQVAARIGQINEGQVSAEKWACADAGLLSYRAYKYNSGNRTYEPVLLRVEGDMARQNLSPAAQELITYVRSLDLLEELLGCDP